MKKTLIILLFVFGYQVKGQFTDDMENYTIGERIFEGHWTDFNCGGSCAIFASDDIAHGGQISGFIPNDMTTDGVLDLGNKLFDIWQVEFWMYIAAGKEAYFTVLSTVPFEPPQIGHFYFNLDNNSPGEGIIEDVALGDVPFTFPHDEWFHIQFTVDITSGISESTWQLFIDENELIPCGTPFTTEFGDYPYALGGIEFYTFTPGMTFYLDDFSYTNPSNACQLGLEDNLLEKFNIHPNPVRDRLILLNHNGLMADFITIYDISGRKVLKTRVKGKSINVSSLTPGLYLLHIITEAGTFTQKFIKE